MKAEKVNPAPLGTLSKSAAATRGWGKKLGRLVKGGEIIGLTGELGSGKTCFVRGVAEGLEVDPQAWIRSPTFTLINEYQGRLPIYHIDLYRLGSPRDMEELDLREYLFSEGVSLIEWFDYLPSQEVKEYLLVNFAYAGAGGRKIVFAAYGDRYENIVEGLRVQGLKRF